MKRRTYFRPRPDTTRRTAHTLPLIGLALAVIAVAVIAVWLSGKPALPTAPTTAVPLATNANPFGFQASADPIETFFELIDTSPSSGVRDSLAAMLHDGRVAISIGQPNAGGIPGLGSVTVLDTLPPYRFIFTVNPEFLFDATIDTTMKQLIIAHEYEHIRQVLDGKYPAREFVGDAPLETRQQVLDWYNAELEAYLAECQLADKLNYRGDYDLLVAWRQHKASGVRHWVLNHLRSVTWAQPYLKELEHRAGPLIAGR